MRKVELDFARKPSGHPILGGVVAALGLIAILTASWRQTDLEAKLARIDGQRLRQNNAQVGPARVDPQAETRARELSTQFRRPWEALFSQLEKTDVKGVQLSQVLPQAVESTESGQRRVLLGGEAEDTAPLYEYLRRLRDQSELQQVHLLQQRWDEQGNVVRFQIAAQWTDPQVPAGGAQ
ncbi:hypothetical protein [Chitinimonas sp. BJB300]|uniref:hypothetical protein n=1 Tax=Chitinimonas sp. BJB300 TaxID=1559339 RepID=UPI000C0DE61A|nr:hypothetical protein [Chitinimonas sp. BJB300]PHV13528.1 hypothetical protein CSQ89_00395 [Chitinimonas sp. BJB300]TSJ89789.1 hypothetical protein FG002_006145 [Chitinimonas sp. BJB300]